MKYIFLLLTLMSFNSYAEDCLDREDDRWAHEYYSSRYEAHKERRRHNNDECNQLFEMRNRVRQLDAELFEERLARRRLELLLNER